MSTIGKVIVVLLTVTNIILVIHCTNQQVRLSELAAHLKETQDQLTITKGQLLEVSQSVGRFMKGVNDTQSSIITFMNAQNEINSDVRRGLVMLSSQLRGGK